MMMDEADPRHGTPRGAPTHRRLGEKPCDACNQANALYQRRQRKIRAMYGDRMVPNLGARRRVQALMRLGWSAVEICKRAGMSQANLWNSLDRPSGLIYGTTARRIAHAYDVMSMQLPPADTRSQRISVSRSRNLAERRGWAPPLAWDDIDNDLHPAGVDGGGPRDHGEIETTIVDRLLLGERITSTRAEKEEAMRRWLADGKSQRELCLIHGWKQGRYAAGRAA